MISFLLFLSQFSPSLPTLKEFFINQKPEKVEYFDIFISSPGRQMQKKKFLFVFDKIKIIRKIALVLSCIFHVCVFLIFPIFSLFFLHREKEEKMSKDQKLKCISP